MVHLEEKKQNVNGDLDSIGHQRIEFESLCCYLCCLSSTFYVHGTG